MCVYSFVYCLFVSFLGRFVITHFFYSNAIDNQTEKDELVDIPKIDFINNSNVMFILFNRDARCTLGKRYNWV